MRYCLLFLFTVVTFSACEKTESPKSKQDVLRGGKWWVDNVSVAYHKPMQDADSVYRINTIDLPECYHDNRIVFRDGTQGGHTTGEEKCGAELDEYQFTWGITESDTKIYFYGAASFLSQDNVNAKLKEIADDRFVIVYDSYRYLEGTGNDMIRDTSEYTVTFIRK